MANWANQRAYFELCYSDTVPLYGAELLSQGKFPYKSSWMETDSTGKQKTQYDGTPAVRYMEYPVLTGVYQYVSMALAKTYTALTKAVSLPVVAEVVMFFDIAALGWRWRGWRRCGRRRGWPGAGSGTRRWWRPRRSLIFQAFTNFDALATAFATGAMLAWARRRPRAGRRADRPGGGGQAVSAAAARAAAGARRADRAAGRGGQDGASRRCWRGSR